MGRLWWSGALWLALAVLQLLASTWASSTEEAYQIAENVRQSPCDPRRFRLVTLPNQMRVLLVHDPHASTVQPGPEGPLDLRHSLTHMYAHLRPMSLWMSKLVA